MGVSQMSLPAPESHDGPGRVQPAGDAELPPERYLDREESWLRFNERVLELAEDESIPLLERVRFLAIFATNLDEFFMVRVAGLVRRMVAGFPVEGAGVRLPGQVLANTLELAGELTVRHARAFSERVNPELAERGIEILRWKELSAEERGALGELFAQRIYPVLTPLVVDPAHPFPFISGLSLNLPVMIAHPRTDATVFARVKVPPLLPRFEPAVRLEVEDTMSADVLDRLVTELGIDKRAVYRVSGPLDLSGLFALPHLNIGGL